MKSKSLLLLLATLAMLIFAAGCIFSPDKETGGGPPPPPSTMPYPGSRDQLMLNFKQIYEDMDYDAFREMMHEDYFMILQQSTIDDFPSVGPTIDLAEELRMHERMFAGDPVTDPDGVLVPGISSISFEEFRQLGEWVKSPPNDPIPNADSGTWQVDFLFARPGFLDFSVKGQIKFYVSKRDSTAGGITKDYWQMVGQKDETFDQ